MSRMRARTLCAVAAMLVAASCSSGGPDASAPPPTADRSSETTLVSGEPEFSGDSSTTTVVEATPAADPTEVPTVAPIEWERCGGIDCATVTVPRDHADPDGETIELAVSRIESRSDDPIGSLFINFGGPGAETGEILADNPRFWADFFGEWFHVVGWDPRGTGESARLFCDNAGLFEGDFSIADPSDGFETEVADVERFFSIVEGCGLDTGPIIDDLSTADAARDLDLLRQAVGDDTLSYLGFSYGTQIGWVYATLFPENTRALVLDGAVPPGSFDAEGIQRWFAAADRALGHFDEVCDREPTCLARDEGFIERVDRVAALLEASSIALDDGTEFGVGDYLNGVFNSLYLDPFSIGADLDRWMVEIEAGDPSGMIEYLESGLDTATPGAFEAVACADGSDLGSTADYEAYLEGLLEASPRFGRTPLALLCDRWPGEPDPLPAIDTAGSAPILVIGNTFDPATPYEDAVSLTEQLDDAVLLTYAGAGHTVVGFDPCVDGVVLDYLIDLVVIDDNLECRASSGQVGVLVDTADDGSVVVLEVSAGSAAEAAGFAVGDTVTAIDGVPVTSIFEVGPFVRGEPVTFDIARDGSLIQIPVTPTGQPWT